MDNKRLNILDILILLTKGKKFIIIFTAIMSVIAVTYSLVVDEKWASEVTLFPLSSQGAFSMAGSIMEGLGLGGSMMTPKAMNLRYSALLKSRTITEETIRKYDLINYFKIKEADSLKAMDIAIETFHSEMLKILINEEINFMTIRIITKDKYFSREIVQHYLDKLLHYSQNNVNNLGRQKRELLENRINQITEDMLALSSEISEYQKQHNIIEIESQAKASIEGYSSVIQELITLELELSYTEKMMPNSIKHRDLNERRRIMLETLRKLENDNSDASFFLALGNINDNLFTIQEKIFGLEIYKKILETIYPQLELARLEELDNMDKLEIVDYPHLPGRRAFPQRALICVATFMVSFLFSSGCVLVAAMASDEDKEKLRTIWKNLFR